MIRIVTDSSCDLPDDAISQYRIEVVPLTIRFGEDELVDREELSSQEFWRRLTTGGVHPETAAPSVGRFQQAFTRLVSSGADGIVVVGISSKISATMQAATLAADQFTAGVPLRLVDSQLVSAALGLAVISAAEVAYLMAAVEHQFPGLELCLGDVLSTFAGVRPVVASGKEDPSKESRDHVVWEEEGLVTVTGGNTLSTLTEADGTFLVQGITGFGVTVRVLDPGTHLLKRRRRLKRRGGLGQDRRSQSQ